MNLETSTPSQESHDNSQEQERLHLRERPKSIASTGLLLLLLLAGLLAVGWGISAFLPPDSTYLLSRNFLYADFRFWPNWVHNVCRLLLIWGVISLLIAVFLPKNEERLFLIRRSFFQAVISVFFAFFIWSVWHNQATLPLATLFAPFLSPVSDYVYHKFTLPLVDYYTTGQGSNPLFWPIAGVIALIVLFVVWRVWFHFRRWKRGRTTALVFLFTIGLTSIGNADESAPTLPKKVETSVGIYDVQSKDDLLNFSADEIRELVKMEDNRTRGAGKTPHPVLVYCFEERSFQYIGGKYDNTELKYRLHAPQKIKPGRKYPLAIHLHGIGEAGDDNTFSLAHLHSLLPILVGPEQLDFYLLVLQCPKNNRHWSFKDTKDGNLDILMALIEHVLRENPIDNRYLSVFGLSSGGAGVWNLITACPDKFASAVPVSSTFKGNYKAIAELNRTSVWSFKNKGDGGVTMPPLQVAMQLFEQSGGFMKITIFDQGGHAAWRPAMDECNCFSWMIAQKRGGWFNPPPERKVYHGRSLSESFYAFFLPLILAAGLFMFQRTALCERLHERIADRFYHRWDDDEYEEDDEEEDDEEEDDEEEDDEEEDDEEEDEDESDDESTDDGFRTFMDATGMKKIKAKIIGFQGDAARLQFPDGKIAPVAIKHFSEVDQEWLRKIKPEQPLLDSFRKWSNVADTQSFVAKFVGFQGDDKVLLQSQAGQTMPVPINQLGQAEQEFLASQREQSPAQPHPDGFRIWTDNTGAKKITAKLLDFLPDGKVRLEFPTGKVTTVDPKFFCEEDQKWLQNQPPPT